MRLELAVVAAVLCMTQDPARSTTDPSRDAYARGRDALQQKRDRDALRAFSEAVALARSPEDRWKGIVGLALSYELIGDVPAARQHYRRFLRESEAAPVAEIEPWPRQRAVVIETIGRLEDALLATHARVELDSAPAAAALSIAPPHPHDCGAAPCTLFLLPGEHEIRCSWPELETGSLTLAVSAGQRRTAICRPPSTAGLAPASEAQSAAAASPVETAGWPSEATVLLVSGGALVVAGGVMSVLAADDFSELESVSREPGTDEVLARYDRTAARLEDRRLAAGILYGVGGAAIVGGILLGVLSPDAEPVAELETSSHGVTLRATMRF